MQTKPFPKFKSHLSTICFHCENAIDKKEKPINYGFPYGQFGIWCDLCKLRTYYDTPDQSIKFNAMGDPLLQTCSCGCTTPRNEWLTEYQWPQCPNCAMI